MKISRSSPKTLPNVGPSRIFYNLGYSTVTTQLFILELRVVAYVALVRR